MSKLVFVFERSMIRWLSRKTDRYGDESQWVTPVPISNTEVKPLNADDSVKAKIGSRQTKESLGGLRNRSFKAFSLHAELACSNSAANNF